ncbi:hypothetical protein GCM10009075_27930 [Sphingomonas trueperi]
MPASSGLGSGEAALIHAAAPRIEGEIDARKFRKFREGDTNPILRDDSRSTEVEQIINKMCRKAAFVAAGRAARRKPTLCPHIERRVSSSARSTSVRIAAAAASGSPAAIASNTLM